MTRRPPLVPLEATRWLRAEGLRPCHCACEGSACLEMAGLVTFRYREHGRRLRVPVCVPCAGHLMPGWALLACLLLPAYRVALALWASDQAVYAAALVLLILAASAVAAL